MIEGITVLAQETITPPTGDIIAALIFAMVFCILGIIGVVLAFVDSEPSMGVLGAVCIMGALVLGMVGFSATAEEPYTEYKVLIDQNVSWAEIYENYEIIDQEGQIYTIKEK